MMICLEFWKNEKIRDKVWAADINEATLKSDDLNKKSVGMRRQVGDALKSRGITPTA